MRLELRSAPASRQKQIDRTGLNLIMRIVGMTVFLYLKVVKSETWMEESSFVGRGQQIGMCMMYPLNVVAQSLARVPPSHAGSTVHLPGSVEWTPGHHARILLGALILGIETGAVTTIIVMYMLAVTMIDDDLQSCHLYLFGLAFSGLCHNHIYECKYVK